MIPFLLLFLPFLHLAVCGPLANIDPFAECILDGPGGPGRLVSECREVIDMMIQSGPTGFMMLAANATIPFCKGACEGTLHNKKDSDIRINQQALASIVTSYVLGDCFNTLGLWGFIETDDYSFQVWPYDDSEHNKRDVAGTTCVEYLGGVPPPDLFECQKAIEHLIQQNGTVGTMEVAASSCARKSFGGCAAFFCNNKNNTAEFDKSMVAQELTANVLEPCIVQHGKYGLWESDDGDTTVALYEARPQT